MLMSSAVAFAASDDAAQSEASDVMAIEEDVLSVADGDDSILSADETGNVVTNETFFSYFDDSGVLLDNVSYDELIFEGCFNGLDVSYVSINKPITFTGHDAVFEDITFSIDSDNVAVDGFTVLAQSGDVSAFAVYNYSNVTLSNNVIDLKALEGHTSFAVYAGLVDNFNLINNTIFYVGNTDGTVFNNALRIEGEDEDGTPSTNIVVSGNTFEVQMPSVDIAYDPDTWESTVMNDAIVFYYCEDLMFVDNNVNVEYNDVTTDYGWDSMYAVSVRSDAYTFGEIQSSGVLIADNVIYIEGHSCVYPVYVCSDDFEVACNNITSVSETYLAHGIDVDGPSAEGIVAGNGIIAEAPLAAYGIYSYQYMGAIEDIAYCDNIIGVTGYASAGMEIVECNPAISGNKVLAEGNYTYGVVASIRDEGIISGNMIVVNGSNIGGDATGDSLMPRNSMGITVKGDCLIEDNIIPSTNIGINLVEDGTFTINNNTVGVKANSLIDSYTIYSHGLSNLTVTDNKIAFIGNTDGTVFNNALRIEGDDEECTPASNIVVSGNLFRIEMPSVGYYVSDPDSDNPEVMLKNDAIVFYYCEYLEFADNRIDLAYNDVTSVNDWDALYAVSVRGDYYVDDFQSRHVSIMDNTIDIYGHYCVYAVNVCADDFEVVRNNITSVSETYLAHGIDVDGPSAEGIVAGNGIIAEAPLAAYGIYSYQYMGAIEDIAYCDNIIGVTGYASAGMEIVECNPAISGNKVLAEGNYTYGVVASIRDEGIISGNMIVVNGSNIGGDATGDSLMPRNSMGITVKGDCLIEDNIIPSTNIGINLVEDGTFTINNNTVGVKANSLIDSYTIYSHGLSNLTVTDNKIAFIGNTDGTVFNNALRIEGDDEECTPASNIVVSGNLFRIEMPSVGYYVSDPDSDNPEVMLKNDAIVFYYCEYLEFADNRIDLAYNDVTSVNDWDALYAVSVRGDYYVDDFQSRHVSIMDNTIDIYGHYCVYAVNVCADDFEVVRNNITSVSETYLAHGIDVDAPSAGGLVAANDIVVEAPVTAYGIFSYGFIDEVKDIGYSANTIDVSAYGSVGMAVFEYNPEIIGNVITAKGNYTFGITTYANGGEGIVSGNEIDVSGSNICGDETLEGLMPDCSIAISVESDFLISDNDITSTAIGIDLPGYGAVVVDNNTIEVMSNTKDFDNHAIRACYIDSLVISNNEICYVGATAPKDDYETAKAYAVYVIDSHVVMANNTLEIEIPSLPAEWEEVPPGSWNYVRHAYSEGIVFDGCNDSALSNNYIKLTYYDGNYGSIYAVDILDCDNFTVEGNTIDANGESYLYALIIEGEDFNITNNQIYSESGYYACGIDIEGTSNGVIDLNWISAMGEVAYPIYGGMMGPVSCDITQNYIIGEGYFIVGIELGGEDVAISDNEIYLIGNHTIGVGVSVDSLVANNNLIECEASNAGSISIWDSIGTDTAGIKSKKGTVEITENVIYTTGEYSVDIADCEGTVNSNYLVSDKLVGDNSVSSTGPATVYNNTPNLKVVLFATDLEKTYDDGELFVVAALDENGEPMVNVTLVALVEDFDTFLAETDERGVAVFDIELPKGVYNVTTVYVGDKLHSYKTIENTITVYPKRAMFLWSYVQVSTADVAQGIAYFNFTLVDDDHNPLANRTVSIDGVGEFVTDENGVASYQIAYGAGEYNLVMRFAGDEYYTDCMSYGFVDVYPVETEIVADANMTVLVSDIVNGAYFNLTLLSGDQELANKTISISFAGQTGEFTTDENGVISYKLPLASAGNYTIDMAFAGDDIYGASNASASVAVNMVASKIYLRNALYFVTETKMVKVTLCDGKGNALAGKTVRITLDEYNLTYSGVTDENGDAYIRVGVGFGTHNATVSFDGDEQYSASNRTGSIRVIKQTPSIMVRGTDSQFNVRDSPKTLKVYLWDRYSKPLPANSKVAVKVNGQIYIGFTDADGIANINININKKGIFYAELMYAGNSAYNAVTRTIKIQIK